MKTVLQCVTVLSAFVAHSTSTYTVTIYPQILSQGGRTQFEKDRWNSHNGLDPENFIANNLDVGSRTGRWLNPDLNSDIFVNSTEDPNKRGYPDPNYFRDPSLQERLCSNYLNNLAGYGNNRNIVMEIKGQFWPKWMNTSLHGGVFPNNLDAGAEMIALLLDAVNNYTKGQIPAFFEVINEPDTLYQYVTWDAVIEFHKIVAKKLHEKHPLLKVGGPTKTGAVSNLDQNGFSIWRQMRDFMNMSLEHLDFLSFHPYNSLNSTGDSHEFHGINEARLVAVIDMVESYAGLLQDGKSVPIITSEYGQGRRFVDAQTPASLVRWAYAFMHNSQMFTFLNHRDVMEQAVAFLLTHVSENFGNASIFYQNGTDTIVGKAYRFWKNFDAKDQFLRVDSQYNGEERTVSPLTLFNSETGSVNVLLNNYMQKSQQVELNFDKNWAIPSMAQSTCLYLGPNGIPIFHANQTVKLFGNTVEVPPESTCFFAIPTTTASRDIATVHESTVYSKGLVIPFENTIAQTNISLPVINGLVYARLRFAVSTSDMSAQTLPASVTINGQPTQDFYTLYDPDRVSGVTQWEVYNYQVPTAALKPGNNAIKFSFTQTGGKVSTVALIFGKMDS